MTAIVPLLIPDWPAPAHVRAALTLRAGGVSSGPYATLNLGEGVGDDPQRVGENRRRLRAALDLECEPGWLKQVHGTRVVQLTAAGNGRAPEADASYTTEPGVACVILTADCLPVLMCDEAGTVVAAAHAGWRGLAAGVLEATVRTLPVPPQRLMAWMGTAIGPSSFEVGGEVREAFVTQDAETAACFKPIDTDGKFFADLYGLARRCLQAAGVRNIFGGDGCTYRGEDRFFSYRRDGATGRQAALVWRT